MNEPAYWVDEQESGPPTEADDAWWQHHIASLDYPRLKREPKQLSGQQRLDEPPPGVFHDWSMPHGQAAYENVYENVICPPNCPMRPWSRGF